MVHFLLLLVITMLPMVLKALGVRLRTGVLHSTLITTTALNTAYGAQYRDNTKSARDLRQQIYATATFDKLFKVEYTPLTVWERGVSRSSNFIQPAQLGWTSNGQFSFEPSPIPTYAIKVDLEFSSFEVEEGFVGWAHTNNVPQTAQQLVRYIMEHHVQQQFVEDVELELAFRGVRVNPTPGTAGAVGTGINGVYTVINDGITAGTIVPVAVGAAPTTAVAYMRYIEAFVEGINFRDRRRPMELAVSEAACSLFEVGMLATYNQNYEATDNLRRVFRYKNILLVPQVAMGNSTKIFCTPIGNAIKPVNVGKGPLWQFETDDRKIKAWTNTRIGYGFWDHSRVYTNDVELVPVTVPFVCAGPGYGAVTLESSGPIFGVGSSGYITVRSSDGTLTTFANGGTPTFTEDSYCIWASDAAGEPAGDLTDITIAALIPELDLSGWTALDRLCITLSGTTLDLTGPAYLDYLELLYNSALETVTVPVGLQIGNFNADGCALNEASVDALCNALDPTVTGRTSLISGGSNAAPTSASQVARDAYDVNNALYTN